jgi:translation initiation factor IF-2
LSKKRIHELAKDYEMSGKDLAAKLKRLGFSQVKSHMTALDDFEVIQVQGILEAHGIIAGSAAASAESSDAGDDELGGLIVRKKKKKKKTETDGTAETPPVVPELEPEAAPQPAAEVSPEAQPAEAATLGSDSTTTEEAGEASAQESEPESPQVDDVPLPESVHPEDPDDAATEATKDSDEAGPESEATEDTESAAKGPAGKVVGFIDLSAMQQAVKKNDSKRHTSRDDATPNVQPTFGVDRRRAIMSGDRGPRAQLSAADLRQREAGRFRRRSGGAKGREERKPRSSGDGQTGSPHSGGTVKIEEPVTIKKLAESLALKANQVLKVAFSQLGFGAVNINSLIDEDTAILLASEFEVTVEVVQEVEAEETLISGLKERRSLVEEEHLDSRPPTVAFLGHVDHGKTTLLDAFRESKVADGEDGGITQHIGAYKVSTESGHSLTILDTPGHAAFTQMRARGASAVDVVVLVVAADSGVQPQTEEAISHARAAGTPIVVAFTKTDRPEANAQRAKEQLSGLDLISEEWGGSTGMVEVCAPEKRGLNELLERVFLESEILELQAHEEGDASGVVIEAEVLQGRGIVAHLLVQDGTLKKGDVILAGEGYGKVRSINDDRGQTVESAGPSSPVEVSGLSALPGVGEPFHVVELLEDAKEVAEERSRKLRENTLADQRRSDASVILAAGGKAAATVNLIVRADVQGSAEVMKAALNALDHEEVKVQVLQASIGAVTENDILLASTSGAFVIAFRVGIASRARQAAEREGIDIKTYQVLYEVLQDVHALMEGKLSPDFTEEITGHAHIKQVFKSSKFGNIAGCMVLDGKINRNNKVRLLRDDQVIWTGELASVRREKEEVKDIREGFECGLLLKNYNDIRDDDIIESYAIHEVKRTLGSA